jgi:hypothetical protein
MNRFYLLLTAILLTNMVWAQAPQKMSYQAVIRGANNALVTNQQVGMQISILQGSTAVYEEIQTPTSNTNGLVSLEIGTGTVISGSFAAIDWSADTYFIKTETDPTGGTNYTITGTSQLLSVPFALYATTSGDGITTDQSDAIVLNTAKVGVTSAQANEIVANTAKTGITSVQSEAIVANTAKVGYTEAAVSANTDVAANTAKVGYTEAAVSANTDVAANTAKVGYTEAAVSANTDVAANTAKVGYTEALVSANTDVAANTLKVSYTQPIYTVNTFYAELGGYVIQISPNGKHGLVVAMQDQGSSKWYEANDLLSNPSNHDADGKEFSDWRLPTKRELNLMSVVYKNGNGASLNANYYWSSTESATNNAWIQVLNYGTQNINDKSQAYNVRAVRAF